MRDILNDIADGQDAQDSDPMRLAREHMKKPMPKRFYDSVAVAPEEGGFAVHLDGRAVRTPGAARLALPKAAMAQLVADEYAAQAAVIDATAMPVTRLVNTAVDGVANDPQAVTEDILRYAATDLLCYRAESPERLAALQAEAWDPVLDWARAAMGAHFVLAEGVMHVAQPRETLALVSAHMRPRGDPFRLGAMHVMTSLTGSALLAMAVEARAIAPSEAWSAAHVDEDWNIAQWGEDAEATARRRARERDMMGAAALIEALDD